MINTWKPHPTNTGFAIGTPAIDPVKKRWEEGGSIAAALVGAGVGYVLAGRIGGGLGLGSSYIGFVTKTSVAAASGYLGYVIAQSIWKTGEE